MANVQNSFIRSKLNKDLDARLVPNGEYRDAKNVQVSRSDGSNVGSLENILGNVNLLDFSILTSARVVCIGKVVSEPTNEVYLFLTSNTDPNPSQLTYNPSGENYIIVYNSLLNETSILVTGEFLNFSTTHEIYHANLLEGLLFWTDNRNQPRKINVNLANPSNLAIPTYYTTEDQISVAKYNPFQPIQLWQEVNPATSPASYETTMKDVTSKTFPNGATALTGGTSGGGGGATITLLSLVGEVPVSSTPEIYGAASVGYISQAGAAITPILDSSGNPVVVDTVVYGAGSVNEWTVGLKKNISGAPVVVNWPTLAAGTEIVFNANTYYDKDFAGDPNFLEDKFVRFSYRFRFDDNEYSLMAPFTQVAFIPKQDGYFMYVRDGARNYTNKDDQSAAYRSTVVSFVENKVDAIKLLIPLPFLKSTIVDSLKIAELDILYKESDALAIKVIETISASELISGTDSSFFEYDYLSKKPYKVLPSSDTTRVYDKVPVRAFAQESSGNRIIYGNFQNKHTPPSTLDYNVAVDAKADFDLKEGTAISSTSGIIAIGGSVTIGTPVGTIQVGSIVTSATSGVTILANTSVTGGNLTSNLTFDKEVTLVNPADLVFTAAGPDTQTVSKIEYPNHSLKQNRNYQVGVVLSDRYGRTSTVILSRSNSLINGFRGDTIYSPYLSSGVEQDSWPGESLKILFNSVIGPSTKNVSTGEPGLYNGLASSADYNPLGWYSYKIVVKQTEQEYYNVYLPGIMASYPQSQLLELGKTSHAVLLNDNINKVPRDLTEVGPDQKQFRSSVQLFGRVQNTAIVPAYETSPPADVQDLTNAGALTDQYYPGTSSDTVSTISTLNDLFEYNPSNPPVPNYFPQFYLSESNPLIARISTGLQIGQTALTNYFISSALVDADTSPNVTGGFTDIVLKNIISNNPSGEPSAGDIITAAGVQDGVTVTSFTLSSNTLRVNALVELKAEDPISMIPGFPANFLGELKTPGIQYLAVYETEPVESLLDIFWESTSTGEVNELNTLILNATGGGAGLINTSTSDWDESYVLNNTIFNQDFQIVDSFNTPILPNQSAPAISLVSVTLDSVINGYDTDVQFGGGGASYFNLTQPSPGFFNIELLAAYIGQGAGNGIYFGQDSELRNFRFNIVAVTTDGTNQTTNTYAINAGPSNVSPFNATPTITTQPALAGTIHSNRLATSIATCTAANGSSKGDLKAKGVSWIVRSAFETNATSNYPNGANLATGENGPVLFSATNTEIISGSDTLAKGVIQLNSDIAPAKYDITVGVQDAGGGPPVGTNFTFVLDLVIVPASVGRGFANYCLNNSYSPTPTDCPQGDFVQSNYVAIEITSSTISTQNGFYVFDVGDFTFSQWQNENFDGGIITLNRTNAVSTGGAGQPIPSDIPAFANNLANAQQILEERNYSGNADFGNSVPQTGAISNYVYEIV